jgi:two-component sensor histidine kinase
MVGDDVEVVWTEQGGPEVATPNGEGGYGSKLLSRTMTGSLGGSITHNWSRSGALITLKIDGRKLAL